MILNSQSEIYSTDTTPKSFTIADFNQDSYLDIAVTNFNDHTLTLMFGDQYGKIQSQQNYSTGNETYPWGITANHFNNDTFIDLGRIH
jgi:hypothetical protein